MKRDRSQKLEDGGQGACFTANNDFKMRLLGKPRARFPFRDMSSK